MLRYPVLCCSGVQNKRLGESDFSATCAEPGRANSREQNANATFEVSIWVLPACEISHEYRPWNRGEFVTMPVNQHFESHVSMIGAFLNRKVVVGNQGDLVPVRVSG